MAKNGGHIKPGSTVVINSPLEIFPTFLSSAIFFQNRLFRKILSEIPSECQKVWIRIRPDFLSGLIWVQTVCKSYQQTALGDKELVRIFVMILRKNCLN